MLSYQKFILCSLFILTEFVSLSQIPAGGIYIATDTLHKSDPQKRLYRFLKIEIRNDTISWFRTNYSVSSDFSKLNQKISRGIIRKFGSDYLGSVALMECDSCPKSWKNSWLTDIDTIYHDLNTHHGIIGATVYFKPSSSEIDQRRVSHLFIKYLSNGDLYEGYAIYRRQKIVPKL